MPQALIEFWRTHYPTAASREEIFTASTIEAKLAELGITLPVLARVRSTIALYAHLY